MLNNIEQENIVGFPATDPQCIWDQAKWNKNDQNCHLFRHSDLDLWFMILKVNQHVHHQCVFKIWVISWVMDYMRPWHETMVFRYLWIWGYDIVIWGLILGLRPANKRQCCFITTSHWLVASLESSLNIMHYWIKMLWTCLFQDKW